MALGKEIGEFSLKQTSATYAEDGGSVSVSFDGTVKSFDPLPYGPPFALLGTLTARGEPGAKQGHMQLAGAGLSGERRQLVHGGRGHVAREREAPMADSAHRPNFRRSDFRRRWAAGSRDAFVLRKVD
jgi:hypothetical protein